MKTYRPIKYKYKNKYDKNKNFAAFSFVSEFTKTY